MEQEWENVLVFQNVSKSVIKVRHSVWLAGKNELLNAEFM